MITAQQFFLDADHSEIVKQCRLDDGVPVLFGETQLVGQDAGVRRDPLCVPGALGVFPLQGGGQGHDDVLARIELAPEIANSDQRRESSPQLLATDRLRQEVVRPVIERPDLLLGRGQCGEHDDRNGPPLGCRLDPRARFEPVHARHHHVEKNQGRPVLLEQLDRLESVPGDDYVVSPLPEVLFHEL